MARTPTVHARFSPPSAADEHVVAQVSTDVAVLGGRKITLPAGWTQQRLVAILGGAEIDARATPGEYASLSLVTVLGGSSVYVPEGARVSIGGFAFLGGREVDVTSREDGPEIHVTSYSILGGLRVTERR